MTQVIYDTETYPNFFALGILHAHSDYYVEFECSEFRDDSAAMFETLRMLAREQVEMVGFNNLGFDYPVLHHLIRCCFNDRGEQIRWGVDVAKAAYEKAEMIIRNQDRFGHQIWQSDRFIPQIDLYKVHHFDNVAKSTSLKVLQFTMRAPSVEDLPISPGTRLTQSQAEATLKYMQHDIEETKRFAGFSAPLIAFRRALTAEMNGDVLNWSDVKIGSEMLIQRLGKKLCYHYVDDKREPRQTPRSSINVADILFPYIKFERRECRDLLERFRSTVIRNTKASVSDSIELDGFAFHFGTGGVHGSADKRAFHAIADRVIIDADVTSLYPSIVIENNLSPAHLEGRVAEIARSMRSERAKTKKGDTKNAAIKLALNGGVFGMSNNDYSPMYDPQYSMTITINGQLLLLMLAERLLTVPGLQIIQVNTDGITFTCPPGFSRALAEQACVDWQSKTMLQLEFAEYRSMFVRDVNAYIAVGVDGKVKRKGAYDFPTPEQPIGTAPSGPRAWHGDSSYMVVPMAADAALVHGVPVEVFIRDHRDPFDFMGRYKTPRGSKLLWGGVEQQRVTRFYRAVGPRTGPLVKESPPPDHAYAAPGAYKRRNGISDAEFYKVQREIPAGAWDERIHTKNKSVYADRIISVAASARVCNVAADFDWSSVDYEWYIAEAAKLVDCFK